MADNGAGLADDEYLDPDTFLAEIRALYRAPNRTPESMNDLAAKIQKLDEWLTRGNVLPIEWFPPEWT